MIQGKQKRFRIDHVPFFVQPLPDDRLGIIAC